MASPDLQPYLAGALLRLDPLVEADRAPLFAVASDPQIWAGHPANDRWRAPVFNRFCDPALASDGALTARDAADGAVVGSSRYSGERAEPGEVEIGWTFLARWLWGGRANAEMKRLMIGHALTSFERVIFVIGEHNLRSRRVMEKIGGMLTDRIQDADVGGRTARHVVYAIDGAQFAAGPLRAPDGLRPTLQGPSPGRRAGA